MKNIVINDFSFNLDDKTYQKSDILNVCILCEDARYKGKTEPFKHTILDGKVQMGWLDLPKFYVGIQIEMKSKEKLYVYVSESPVQFERGNYFKDKEVANELIKSLRQGH